ncbi:unnamed protein product, partial [Hydatigera taeniaeformis]|uniref:Tubulin tyrosine ligase n=1 Tax=Hydatigena taeniaeformis TaxID=6205 RepID=A0A0R3X487_HYDTA
VTEEQDRDITWNAAFFFKKDRSRNGYVNKFPGIHCLLTKISLFKCLEFQRCHFPEAYNFYPPTWFLPHQYDEWASYTAKHEIGTVTYIVKPSGGTQGKGIYLVQSPKEYCKEHMNGRGFGPPNEDEEGVDPTVCLGTDSLGYLAAKEVVQQYEHSPVLVSGFKADLRIYVVLESLKPLRIHVYRDGLVRLASQRYHTPDPMNMRNSKMHLTNYSINKFPDSVDPDGSSQIEAVARGSTTASMNGGSHSDAECLSPFCMKTKTNWQCKRRLHHFIQSGGFETGSKLTPETFWPKVDELVRNTVFALVPYLRVAYWAECGGYGVTDPGSVKFKDSPQCFQIFGFDLLLLEPDCRPVLLEVNSSPSLRIDCMRPLVRYPSVAARQGLSPDIVVNSPKYSAFFRSRVDEAVKLGLLKATLLLMGSRIIHQRLLRYSPEKAKAFLEACGYKSSFKSPAEKDRKTPTEAARMHNKVDDASSIKEAIYDYANTIDNGSNGVKDVNRYTSLFPPRKARNRLHCIYAEDEMYPTSAGIFAENERECDLHVLNNEKAQFPQSFPAFIPTEMRRSSPSVMETVDKLGPEEKQQIQGDLKFSKSGYREYPQPSPPTTNSVAHLRMVDRLAEIFMHILSIRRPHCSRQRPPEMVDVASQRNHISRSRVNNNLSFVIYVDPNGKTVSSHFTTANNGTTETQALVDVPIPRMDFTSFRMFTQRCKLKNAGISIREVDILYMKHRLHWFHVFEPDSPSADTVIAQKYFTSPSSVGDACHSIRQKDDQVEPMSDTRKRAFTAFVEHCWNALNMSTTQSPPPRTATATPKLLH